MLSFIVFFGGWQALGGRQPHEVFDMIVGTSTGGVSRE